MIGIFEPDLGPYDLDEECKSPQDMSLGESAKSEVEFKDEDPQFKYEDQEDEHSDFDMGDSP